MNREIYKYHLQIDFREQFSGVIDEIKALNAFNVELAHIRTGDYFIEHSILVERKTIADFFNSVKSKRIFDQAYRLAKIDGHKALIVEGPWSELSHSNMSREAVQGSLIHLKVFLGIPVLRSIDNKETAHLLLYIARQYYKNQLPRPPASPLRKPKLLIKNTERDKILFLQNIPGIGFRKAMNLLQTFGTIRAIFTAQVDELTHVPGIGKKLATNIHSLFNAPFEGKTKKQAGDE
ncbi:MAG: hypothetical protein K9I94_15435 [Bacteroidales bacterium]|nr:hypothetical protein [Bacteroidales bacterium]